MFVCVCLAVTESEIAAAIESGAKTREDVTHACLAGSDCGACHGMIEQMIEEHEEHAELRKTVAPPLVPAEALVRTRAA